MYQSLYYYVQTRMEEIAEASNRQRFHDGRPSPATRFRQMTGEALISLGRRIKPKPVSQEDRLVSWGPSWAGR
jgi:hypothetical protein